MKTRIRRFITGNRTAILLAIAGMVLYSALSVGYAFTQASTIDEGLYQYKGYLFAAGTYYPFQAYGPRTLYGPLAYLIPGFVQRVFGPSLLTGRMFGVLTGILALIGLWLAARRLAGEWWGAAAVWVTAINPGVIRNYSFGVDQGLSACLLMWILFFSLKKNRFNWQIVAATVLSVILLLTRQNMAPVLPILVIYIFWEYGNKAGWFAVLAGVVSLLAGHLAFWPGILSMWTPWFPASITPFLNAWRVPAGAIQVMESQQPNASARTYGFLEGLRFNFVALTGFIASLIFWPRRSAWKEPKQFRATVFISGLFLILLVLHTWAGLGFGEGNNFNTFTLSQYIAFFNLLGILVIVTIFPLLEKGHSTIRFGLVSLLILALSTGIGFGGFDVFGDQLININIPRIKTLFTTGKYVPSRIPLWDYLQTTFGIPHNASRMIIPELAGLLAGLAFLALGWGVWAWLRRRRIMVYSISFITMMLFLAIGTVLSPTGLLGGGFTQWNCTGNVITEYKQVGDYLARNIPAGSNVYWDGGNAVAVLLYVPNIHIFPQQLDGPWNFYHGGDSDTLARLSKWNDELAQSWREKADVIITQQVNYPGWQEYLDEAGFVEPQPLKTPVNCAADTYLRLFIRKAN